VIWLAANNVGGHEPLLLDPVNAWTGTLIRPERRPRTSSALMRCGGNPAAAILTQIPLRNLASRFGRRPRYIHLSSWCGIDRDRARL
jgi:hypothetical protein